MNLIQRIAGEALGLRADARVVRSCLDKRRVVRSCLDKRRIIEPKHSIEDTAEIVCVERLGGLLKSYHRLAA